MHASVPVAYPVTSKLSIQLADTSKCSSLHIMKLMMYVMQMDSSKVG